MYLQILIVLFSLGILYSQANYVHQKSPNEFDIDLEEQGVRITQKNLVLSQIISSLLKRKTIDTSMLCDP